ncbi:MAG: TatD DNase family protein [Chloroflexota bacterium]|nr:TatD DNase family protein [Chloroflexota bacterium]
MTEIYDTHCHLYLDEFADDLPDVMQRADEAGIRRMLVPGVDEASSRQVVELSRLYNGRVYAAVGIHPNEADQVGLDQIEAVEALLKANTGEIKAVGEIGLDYYRTWASHEDQVFVLQHMLWLAARYNLPVSLHIREAEQDVLRILGEWIGELEKKQHPLLQHPGVFHSFSGDAEVGAFALQHHFLLGISGPVTFKNDRGLRERLKEFGIQHLIIETDAPYMAPHPKRGRRNEPAFVRYVLEGIAASLDMDVDQAAYITTQNANVLFNWDSV